ncbi:unnamed protein product [Lepidochelys kempii]
MAMWKNSGGPLPKEDVLEITVPSVWQSVRPLTQRIEIEVEEARLQAQKEMMEELQMAKELAQQELWAQRRLYENNIKQLEEQLGEEEMNKKLLSTRKAAEELLVQLPALTQAQDTQQKCSMFLELLEQEKEKLAQEMELLQRRMPPKSRKGRLCPRRV